MTDQDFDASLFDAVRKSLAELVGPTAEGVLRSHVEPRLASKDPTEFVSKLQTIVGRQASEVIVQAIQKSMSQRLGVNVNANPAEFPKFVNATRKRFAEERFARAFCQVLVSGALPSSQSEHET